VKPWSLKTPCDACPYRKDTPPGIWDVSEYIKLRASDENAFGSVIYGCHLNNGQPCAGWLADQKRRNLPSIRLRLALMSDTRAAKLLEKINEDDKTLYPSLRAMIRGNLGPMFPKNHPKAKRLLKKLGRKGPR
jgi:hypothetical protein